MSSQPGWAGRILAELAVSNKRAERVAGDLTLEQLNWTPAPGSWSIGQCLDHLRATNEIYAATIGVSLVGKDLTAVEEIDVPWPSRWFIKNYIAPNPGTRAQAPGKITPASRVSPRILEDFLRSNGTAQDLVSRASRYNVNRIRFKNPFIPLLRFTVGTGLEIISKHESRHLLQAERVRDSRSFPR